MARTLCLSNFFDARNKKKAINCSFNIKSEPLRENQSVVQILLVCVFTDTDTDYRSHTDSTGGEQICY